jgi:hypothetical protein
MVPFIMQAAGADRAGDLAPGPLCGQPRQAVLRRQPGLHQVSIPSFRLYLTLHCCLAACFSAAQRLNSSPVNISED